MTLMQLHIEWGAQHWLIIVPMGGNSAHAQFKLSVDRVVMVKWVTIILIGDTYAQKQWSSGKLYKYLVFI